MSRLRDTISAGWSVVRARPLPAVASGASACAALATLPILPAGLRAVLLLFFILAGPGSVALSWVRDGLPRSLVFALVPAIGVATWTLINTALVEVGVWHPTLLVLCVSGLVLLSPLTGAVRRRRADAEGYS